MKTGYQRVQLEMKITQLTQLTLFTLCLNVQNRTGKRFIKSWLIVAAVVVPTQGCTFLVIRFLCMITNCNSDTFRSDFENKMIKKCLPLCWIDLQILMRSEARKLIFWQKSCILSKFCHEIVSRFKQVNNRCTYTFHVEN